MHIKKYLFDLGNVFFDWNPRHVLKEIIPDEELLNKFLNIYTDDITQSTEEIIINLIQEPKSEAKKDIFYKKKSPYNISKKRRLFTRSIKTYPI